MAKRQVSLGPSGEAVRQNIRGVRTARKWRLEDLSNRLAELGHPLSKATLSQIETGGRRVDVDDLAAISTAFGVSPVDLMSVPTGRDKSPAGRINEIMDERARMAAELNKLADKMLGRQ